MSDQSGVSSETSEAPETGAANTPAEAPEAPAAASPDLSRLYERMDQMSAQQQALVEQFGDVFTPEEEEPNYYDDEGELTEDGIRDVIGRYVDERFEAAMAPRERAAAIDNRDDQWEALKAQFPDLDDRDVANAVIGDALRWASTHNPDLIDRPEFVDVIEWVYRSHKYDEYAQAQQAAAPPGVVLESAAGAAQPTQAKGIDWQKRVMDAAEQSSARI